MKKLWQKNVKNNKLVDQYCFKDGAVFDNDLIESDVYGSIAHSQALVKLKVITKKESMEIVKILKEILALKKVNKFTVDFNDEDVHTKIENCLIKKLGDLGKKIHTARSRNDQILVDLRLYTKEKLFEIAYKTI
jgi:argininosuccinate lyase